MRVELKHSFPAGRAHLGVASFALAALAAAALVIGGADPAFGQLMLPGALQAAPPAGVGKPVSIPRSSEGKERPKAAAPKPFAESSIIGRDLARDGSAGVIAFANSSGKGLEITRLSFVGEGIAHPGEPCRVDVVAAEPIEMNLLGHPHGASRYQAAIEACPFSVDVLEGAVLVSRASGTCDFVAADCRVDPTGLWGPPGNGIDEKQIKTLERERGQAENMMRANFRALLASAGKAKDKAAVKQIASDQAGFSSEREVICRNYLREDVHGFCALRLTQARALALGAEFAAREKERGGPKSARTVMEKKTAPKP